HVDVNGGSARHAGAGFGDCAHHDRRLDDAEPRTAVRFRNADAEPTFLCKRGVKIVRKSADAILLEPVGVIEAPANGEYGVADRFLFGGQGKVHHTASVFSAAGGGVSGPRTARLANNWVIPPSSKPSSCRISLLCSPNTGAGLVACGWVSLQDVGTR